MLTIKFTGWIIFFSILIFQKSFLARQPERDVVNFSVDPLRAEFDGVTTFVFRRFRAPVIDVDAVDSSADSVSSFEKSDALKAGPKQSRGRGKAGSSCSDNNDSRRSHLKFRVLLLNCRKQQSRLTSSENLAAQMTTLKRRKRKTHKTDNMQNVLC